MCQTEMIISRSSKEREKNQSERLSTGSEMLLINISNI